MDLTSEQADICGDPLNRGGLVVVNAYAGSGKSTTLRLLAESHPKQKFLYLCFNKTVAEAARQVFPSNVRVSTMHGVAYGAMCKRFAGSKLGCELRPAEIKDHFRLANSFSAVQVRETLRLFLLSTDKEPGSQHLGAAAVGAESDYWTELLKVTRAYWREMISPDSAVPLSHDGYLKLFVLEQTPLRYIDAILMDEAQDTNAITAQFVSTQQAEGTSVVLVGDRHQAIYRFRGSTNFIEQCLALDEAHIYDLTQSCRFPPVFADMASDVLNEWKGDNVRISGLGKRNKVRSHAFIARTNSTILEHADALVADGQKAIHFAGTEAREHFKPDAKYGFEELLDVYHFWSGNAGAVQSRYLRRFKSFGEIKEMTENPDAQEAELRRMVALVERLEDRLPSTLSRLSASAVGPERAEITLSSAHRAKGLEWDNVQVAEDFLNLCDADLEAENMTEPEFDEEVNLIYVALTRTRGTLKVPQSLDTWWKCYRKGEKPPRSDRMQAKLRRKKGRGDNFACHVLDPLS
jgi:F-box protein 18 (helicase)